MPWPTLAELKQRLDIDSDDWNDQLERVMASAIATTKRRIGDWVEAVDRPNEQQAQSALELAVEMAQSGAEALHIQGSKSRGLLYGQRRRFGIG